MEVILKALEEKGFIEIQPGVFLATREDIMADQATWSEEDEAKGLDFSVSPFWITTDNGAAPEGFGSIEEALRSLGIDKISVCPICGKGFAPLPSQLYDTLRCKRIAGDRRRYETRKVSRRAYQAERKRRKPNAPQI